MHLSEVTIHYLVSIAKSLDRKCLCSKYRFRDLLTHLTKEMRRAGQLHHGKVVSYLSKLKVCRSDLADVWCRQSVANCVGKWRVFEERLLLGLTVDSGEIVLSNAIILLNSQNYDLEMSDGRHRCWGQLLRTAQALSNSPCCGCLIESSFVACQITGSNIVQFSVHY